ncbi:MAG TPA: hypothetical protein PLG21_13740, partial [Anaerolineae bacterium]|nr:hypothetical protein [Anaerolineae bacterium]
MSLDIWFREDIKHILLAAERASDVALAQGAESAADLGALRAYRRGDRAALSAVALACGLTPGPDDGTSGTGFPA